MRKLVLCISLLQIIIPGFTQPANRFFEPSRLIPGGTKILVVSETLKPAGVMVWK